MKKAEQAGPGYDPQVALMRWLPLATNAILTPGGSILTRDVQRTGKYEFLRWNSDGNSYRGKLREKVRAMPRKMKITAENGLKIEKMCSTSPKTRYSGLFFDFSGLQA